MAYRKIDESNLSSLADKIRTKGGTSGGMVFPAGFLSSVDALPDKPVIRSIEVTENGTYSAPDGVDGYSPVIVNVEASGGGNHASGTYTPTSDNQFMKVTGIGFTPKSFKIIVQASGRIDGVAKSHGTIYVNGNAAWIGSNSAGTSYMTGPYFDMDTTPESDDITGTGDSEKWHGTLQTGFYSYGASRPWKAGYTYDWEAWG